MELIKGVSFLLICLSLFSLFSAYAPKGRAALGGLANAAVASFLVEAVHSYITGDFIGIAFLKETGVAAGSMGGPAAAILVCLALRVNPTLAVVSGIAVAGQSILPGFIAGYLCSFIALQLEKRLPEGVDMIAGALLVAPVSYLMATWSAPFVDSALAIIGGAISEATTQSPYIMGLLLGGIIKIVCTSPLSSMALTAILGLTGLPMGIAAIACVGGSFTNGIVFKRLKLGNDSQVAAIMLEPLTQAPIVTANALKIYSCNFFGGAMAGMGAVYFNIINNAPGTAAPIPGLLAPFAFNDPMNVVSALVVAVMGGTLAGYVGSSIHMRIKSEKEAGSLSTAMQPDC
ncbi:PTS sugar transporter subunit IIC [Endozoicomonas sp. Mp262]|uniref:PTS sugar transporter subunit IIC n=1 Tax=Endozoicomonas sp. Mp262 TaxID=2919499 RepID=UPI0021D95631